MKNIVLIILIAFALSVQAKTLLFSDGFEDGTLNAWSDQIAVDVSNIDEGGTNRVGQIAHINPVRSGLGGLITLLVRRKCA